MSIATYFERKELDKLKKSKRKTYPAKDHIVVCTSMLDEIDRLRGELDKHNPDNY